MRKLDYLPIETVVIIIAAVIAGLMQSWRAKRKKKPIDTPKN